MELLKRILIFINYFGLIISSHNSFKNECGPYKGLEDSILMPKKEDCLSQAGCCYVEGEKNLIHRSACMLVEGGSDERIKLIQEMNEVATKINVDCGGEKNFVSDCGIGEKKEKDDCIGDTSDNYKCCFITIDSPQFVGQACKKFDSIDLNDIGEAVVAAKTINAKLEVYCNYWFLNINISILISLILLIFL